LTVTAIPESSWLHYYANLIPKSNFQKDPGLV